MALATAALLATPLFVHPAQAAPREPASPFTTAGLTALQQQIVDEVAADTGARADSDELVRVVVLLKDQPTAASDSGEQQRLADQDALLQAWAADFGLKVDRQFGYLVNGFSAEVPAKHIPALALSPEVASVKKERLYTPVEHTARDAHGVGAAFADYGVDGTGTVISIIDTGVDARHPDLRLDDCSAAKIQTINPNPAGFFTCKVPNGYNYADENFEVYDTTSSQHGQHVAGIAAANGSVGNTSEFATTGRIDGAAPNAQVLAMKVFSNDRTNGRGAQDSDIIAAIEDSVKMGADVINMSLGSDNGFSAPSNGMHQAIEAAKASGVLTVVAASNSGNNFSLTGGPEDGLGRFDDGTVGSPSTASDALSVASLINPGITQLAGRLGEGDDAIEFGYSPATGSTDAQGHRLVYVGLGQEADYTAGINVQGAYALVQRGAITFREKFDRAIAKGAAGVVVFNHAVGGDSPVGMAGLDGIEVFGAGLGHSDGMALVEALKVNPDAQVTFTKSVISRPNPAGLAPSSFTSWGSTADLEFKPEIAGIGGNVYSTIGTDSYESTSGTSMASPNVAGLSALLLQSFRERYPDLTGPQLAAHLKTTLMNTAVPPTLDGVPYAPRQIGAGLARVDLALATDVTATVDGSASVALYEVDSARSFTVTLTNRGSSEVSYTIPAQQVLTETNEAGATPKISVSAETLSASAGSVTVPAGGQAQVTFTLVPQPGTEHFIEGWARFEGVGEAPDLAVPYLGFVGDWGAENIVAPAGQQWTQGLDADTTNLYGRVASLSVAFDAREGGRFALSPNGDGLLDSVVPALLLMRNADQIRYEILDADGNVIRELGIDEDAVRVAGGDLQSILDEGGYLAEMGRSFDGKLWNAQAGASEALADGTYTFRARTRINEREEWQNTDQTFVVDTVAPEVTIVSRTATEVRFKASDSGTGVFRTAVTGADGTSYEVKQDGDTYVATFPEGQAFIAVEAIDWGLNSGGTYLGAQAAGIALVIDSQLVTGDATLVGATASEGLLVEGVVSADIVRVEVDGSEAELDGTRFGTVLDYAGGATTVKVEGFNAAGESVVTRTIAVSQDAVAPELELTAGLDENGQVVVTDGVAHLEGRLSDDRADAELGLLFNLKTAVTLGADGTFAVDVPVAEETTSLVVEYDDGVNSVIEALPIAGRATGPGGMDLNEPKIDNLECRMPLGGCFVNSGSDAVSADGKTLHIEGSPAPSGTIEFIPGSRSSETGEIVEGTPIAGTVTEDGFKVDLPISDGLNNFRMVVRDADGKVTWSRSYEIFFDITPPSIDFSEPTLVGGTLYTNTTDVLFKGTISDDGWGHFLGVNDLVLADALLSNNPGANAQEFERVIAVRDGDKVLVQALDKFGNALVGVVPVIVDQTDPTAGLDGAKDGEVVRDGRTLQAWVADEHLAGLRVSLNGQVVSEQTTKLQSTVVEVEDALKVQVPDEDSAGANADSADAASAEDGVPTADGLTLAEPQERTVAATGTQTVPSETRLSADIATADLAAGQYVVVVEGYDLAGNQVSYTQRFVVDAEAVIEGPDPLELTVERGALADQEKVAAALLANYRVSDDGSAFADGETVLSLLPGTVLVPGEQRVTLVATDADGRVVLRQVTVKIVETSTVTPATPGGSDDGSGSGGSGSGGSGSKRPGLPKTGAEG